MIQINLLSDRTKGYLFALIATVAFANIYIFSKAALNEVSLAQFGIYWFAVAFVVNLLFAWRNKALKPLKGITWDRGKRLVYLWFLELVTTSSFFLSIKMIADPAVTSFMGNMFVVFLVILGVVLLKERFTSWESVGVFITIIGAFAVGYNGGKGIDDFFIPGTGVVLFNCFMAAYTSIVAKKAIHTFNPLLVSTNRTFSLLIFSIIFWLYSGDPLAIPSSALRNVVIGSLLGPVTSFIMIYYSFKYIEASRSSVIQGLKGVFVLLGSYLYFGMFPATIQLYGGIASVVGVLIMTLSKVLLKEKHKQKE